MEGETIFLSHALARWEVGLRPRADGDLEVPRSAFRIPRSAFRIPRLRVSYAMAVAPPSTSSLEKFWIQFGEMPLIDQRWPAAVQQTGIEAFKAMAPEEARRLGERYAFVHGFLIVPIVAVAGLINSGKSSLVSAFLSPESRPRVLRGITSRQGTQRFTLWAPRSWQEDTTFRARLDEMLTRVFRHAPEPLSEEPETAHAQQRAQESLSIPLLAFDGALDTHGIALLDCPDTQRPQAGEAAGTNARLDSLAAAGEICAGVIVITPRTEIEVRELQAIVARLPAATRVYAINLLRREAPDVVLREVREHLGLKDEPCFGAYDFEVDANRTLLPDWDPNRASSSSTDEFERLPCFFELSPDPAQNAPDTIAPERSILRLGARLAPNVLRQKRQAELIAELGRDLRNALRTIESRLERTAVEIADAQRELLSGCETLLRAGGELRIKMDPEIAASMAESIRRTAPLDLRAFFVIKHSVFAGLRKLRDTGQRAMAVLTLRFPLNAAKNKFAASRIDPAQVQSMLALWSASLGAPRDKAQWERDATAILQRFLREERTNMSPDEWDTLTQKLWAKTERRWARAALVVGFLAMLGAVAMIPFDMGASFIGITAKELAVLTVGGSVFGVAGCTLLQRGLEEHIGRQQFANFFALACDQLGLPRELPPDLTQTNVAPHIAEKRNSDAFGIRERRWVLARLNPQHRDTLRALLAAI